MSPTVFRPQASRRSTTRLNGSSTLAHVLTLGGALALLASGQVFATGNAGSSTPAAASGPRWAPPIRSAFGLTGTHVEPVDTTDRAAVLNLYRNVIVPAFTLQAKWTGATGSCVAGSTMPDFQASVVRTLNSYRVLAGLSDNVTLNPAASLSAQEAALMMDANSKLSHVPPPDWACRNAVGAAAAGKSNLALGASGPRAIQLYVADRGVAVLGHRRWVLFPRLLEVGTGDTAHANALQVIGAFGPKPEAAPAVVAWPSRGYMPWSTYVTSPMDKWSLSIAGADFSAAVVSMSNDRGQALAIGNAEPLANGYGDNTLGWTLTADASHWSRSPADTRFTVRVSNVLIGGRPTSFDYEVTFFVPS